MTDKKDLDNVSGESALRDAAEDQLGKSTGLSPELADQTTERIIHELRVHQIELEMQNEELKRVQLELEESRNKYQDLYDFAPVGYFTVSRKGLIYEASLNGASLLGIHRPKLLGRGFGHFVAAESLEQWNQHIISVLNQEERQSCVLTLRREDGSSFYARLESVRMAVPVEPQGENSGGHLVRMAVSDITKRKIAENALVFSEAEKTAILNGITTNIAFVNDKLQILWVNKAAAESVGRSPKEMIGATCHSLWADPERPCENCPTVKAFQTKKSEKAIMTTPDGRVWDERGEPVFDDDGNLIGVVELAQDITDRKRLEEEKEKVVIDLEKALSQVKKLSGFLPICASCKKIRDDQGYWRQVEEYIRDHSEAQFSHGICPDCARKLYTELYENK
ncbi:MAG: PAS domain-containing protein [Pseudomonadota bacterium]